MARTLLDASYEYSVDTTRLFLSYAENGWPAFDEIWTLSSSAC